MLAGSLKPDDIENKIPELKISYKPQKIAPKFMGSVRELLSSRIPSMVCHPAFKSDVMNPLQIELLLDQNVKIKIFLI